VPPAVKENLCKEPLKDFMVTVSVIMMMMLMMTMMVMMAGSQVL
jgi:hypothetical protein